MNVKDVLARLACCVELQEGFEGRVHAQLDEAAATAILEEFKAEVIEDYKDGEGYPDSYYPPCDCDDT